MRSFIVITPQVLTFVLTVAEYFHNVLCHFGVAAPFVTCIVYVVLFL